MSVAATLERVFVAMGANIGDPVAQLDAARAAMDQLPETRLLACSSYYRSAPVGYVDQPDFVNAVAMMDTALPPRLLLHHLLDIERAQGRIRAFPNAPRMLDLDIVLYGARVIDEDGLTIPHARMLGRAFVMLPLAELAPEVEIPGCGQAALLAARLASEDIAVLRAAMPA